jgi:HK97 family phage portal protein
MASLLERLIGWAGFAWDVSTKRLGVKEALSVPPAWYAHNKLTGDFARLPIDVKRKQGQGAVNDTRHDGYRLLREQPNAIQSPTQFKAQILSHALLRGNGRAAIIRSGNGIDELIPMMPEKSWTIIYEGQKYHLYKPENQTKTELFDMFDPDKNGYLVFRDSEVLHITGFSYDGVTGLGLLDIANATFGTAYEAGKFQNNQTQKGFRGKVFLEAPPGMFRSEDKAKEFIDGFNERESGSDNAGRAGLLREGVKASVVSQNNNDAQFVELQKFNRQDIGMLFGLDAMPGDGETDSYSSREQAAINYLQCLDRWLVQFEEQCDMKLRTESEKRLGRIYFKFNTAAILRTALKETIDAMSVAIAARIMNPNEARAKLDLNPYDGGDEFINPNIQQATRSASEGEVEDIPEDDAEDESGNEATTKASNDRAIEETLRSLIKVEANNAINASARPQFVAWIGRNYPKWEAKLADKIEAIGLDRDLARIHCQESSRQLAELATKHGPKDLPNAIKNTVGTWESRVFSLKGAKND